MALSIYHFELVMHCSTTTYSVCRIYNIYALVVEVLFLLMLFFGLFFTLYKVDCKQAEYEIERKRLEILKRHLDELARKK